MKGTKAELQRISSEMKGIIEGINATMAVIEFTTDGTIITANPNFLKSMKYTLEELKGCHHSKIVPHHIKTSKKYKAFWKNLAKGKSFTGIVERVSSEGSPVWLNTMYNPIWDGEGRVIKVVKFAYDITIECNLEVLVNQRTLKVTEQYNLLKKYAHMNSHDVRGPLARVLGLVDIIMREYKDSDPHNLFEKLHESAHELDDIVKRMNRLIENEVKY